MAVLRRQLINIGHMLSGNVMNAAVMLISISIAARALGPATYGIMILILSYSRLIERLLRFESWQPLIKYMADIGSAPKSDDARKNLSRLCLFGLLLDIASCVSAASLSVLLAIFFGSVFGLPPQYLDLILIYSIALCVNITGMPTAALRFSGRFRTIAYSQIIANVVRGGLSALCWWLGYGLLGFVIAWTISQIFSAMIFLTLGLRALHQQGIPSPFFQSPHGLRQQFRGFLSFGFSTNISSGLRTLTQEADSLLVGSLAGPASAGFYYLAKRLAKVALQVGAQIQAVLYPDLARIWAQGDWAQFRQMTFRIQLILGGAGFAILFFAWLLGKWMINLVWGPDYLSTYPLFLTQLIAVICIMHASASRSALLAMGHPGRILLIAMASTAVFFTAASILVPIYGPIGANIAQILLGLVTAIGLDFYWMRISARKMRAGSPYSTHPVPGWR